MSDRPLPPGFPKFKEPKVRKTRKVVAADDRCEFCRKKRAVHSHHVKRRSQGGDDSPENLRRLCVDCHELIHRNTGWARNNGWLA